MVIIHIFLVPKYILQAHTSKSLSCTIRSDTLSLGLPVFSVPHEACYNVVSAESKKQDLYSSTYHFIGGNNLSSLQMNMHVSGTNLK
jgi:hypothetical protein